MPACEKHDREKCEDGNFRCSLKAFPTTPFTNQSGSQRLLHSAIAPASNVDTPRYTTTLAMASPSPALNAFAQKPRTVALRPSPRRLSPPQASPQGGEDPRRRRQSGGRQYGGEYSKKSDHGASFSNAKRRKGRAAHLRSPDDTPLRDGNRDRLMGLLTERAAKTLLYYFFEMNPTLYGWFNQYLKENEIPREGNWDDISGETFLRTLLSMNIEETSWGQQVGVDNLYNSFGGLIVDPRNIAQRVMEVRGQIAKEMIQDLMDVGEENSLLMRETLLTSLSLDLEADDRGQPDV